MNKSIASSLMNRNDETNMNKTLIRPDDFDIEMIYHVGDKTYSREEFERKFEVVDFLPRDCGCEKTCHCEPESNEER